LRELPSITADPNYLPIRARIPFRVILRDFAQYLSASSEVRSVDTCICQQVNVAGSRELSVSDLHRLLTQNPCLLILDGLDEVADPELRRLTMERIDEFLQRCEKVLLADLQVLASTRPRGYARQFNPDVFLHLNLSKLTPDQVLRYSRKWVDAKALEEMKSRRTLQVMEECVVDEQVRLLLTTPLQATILLLIISTGGTPPRQREGLFDEYLEVIYRREKAKTNVITAEKELLLGLHRYVGYLLHNRTGSAESTASTLPRAEYETAVKTYMRYEDPYTPAVDIEKSFRELTHDVGERLVLLVEAPADQFGFELRSLQEFFAAGQLVDGAAESGQRYERFTAISLLPHWRNVALFFAGRVGRVFPGEAANIVEVCRDVDRSGANVALRQGARLALELASDRAFGPNRRLQRSLLELSIKLLEEPLEDDDQDRVVAALSGLSPEDVRDHLHPLTLSNLSSCPVDALPAMLDLALDCGLSWSDVSMHAMRLVHDGSDNSILQGLRVALSHDLQLPDLVPFVSELDTHERQPLLQLKRIPWAATESLARALEVAGSRDALTALLDEQLYHGSFVDVTTPVVALEREPRADDRLSLILDGLKTLGQATRRDLPHEVRQALRGGTQGWVLPEEVITGEVEELWKRNAGSLPDRFLAVLWTLHLLAGDVSEKTAAAAKSHYSATASEYP
jgi:hypothetical protein